MPAPLGWSAPACMLASATMLSACVQAPLVQGSALSSYNDLAPSDGIITKSRLRVNQAQVLAAKTINIAPTGFAPTSAPKLTAEQRALVTNALNRAMCVSLSDRFEVVSSDQPADLTVRAVVTQAVETDEVAAGVSAAASIGTRFIPSPVPIIVPRLPIGPGKLSIEAPAGRVDVTYEKPGEFVEAVRMFNVASYLHAADIEVDVPGLGTLTVDVTYGGNYYAVIEPQGNWPGLGGMSGDEIVDISRKLRDALEPICNPVHPEDERIRGVHHALWCDAPTNDNADGRGAVFYGDKAIDRSPGGTGTSARLAQLHGKGRLKVGDRFRQESLIGTIFEGCIESEVQIGRFKGMKPSVAGWARIIGHNTIFVDDRDPLAYGFQLK